MGRLRIAIVESPNPIDLFEDRSEAHALAKSCRLMGHQAASFFVRSRREFRDTIRYLAAADSGHADRFPSLPLILHISCHGNADCVAMGKDALSWSDLVDDIAPLIKSEDYAGPLVLSLSSCDSAANGLSRHIASEHAERDAAKLPQYIFSIKGESVQWDDALIAWNLLYLKLSKVGVSKPAPVQQALNEVIAGTEVPIIYSRWDADSASYRRHDPSLRRKIRLASSA